MSRQKPIDPLDVLMVLMFWVAAICLFVSAIGKFVIAITSL